MSLTEKLDFLKHRDQLSLEDVAQKTGIPRGTINKIFSGQTKNPSAQSIRAISKLFCTTMLYLLDDELPVDLNIATYAESVGIVPISEQEFEFVAKFRHLDEHGKQGAEAVLDVLVYQAPHILPTGRQRTLVCLESLGQGQLGAYSDAMHLRYIRATLPAGAEDADFAVCVSDRSMDPVYAPKTVLAAARTPTRHGQIGIFLVNREGFVRRLCISNGRRRLISINVEQKDICLTEEDEVECMGTVLGAIRDYDWLPLEEKSSSRP